MDHVSQNDKIKNNDRQKKQKNSDNYSELY